MGLAMDYDKPFNIFLLKSIRPLFASQTGKALFLINVTDFTDY